MPPTATTADTPTIGELLDLPAQVFQGDFVLKLAEGVTRPDETLSQYVVPQELVGCFDQALTFIRSALDAGTSKATYLHGSFGSGKSHFMAVLLLLLRNYPGARAIQELAPVLVKHPWTEGKKFLLVPFHLLNSRNLETAVLGGYVDHIRQHHAEAPLPGVFVADDIFRNAEELRGHMGDDKFFALLNPPAGPAKWKGLAKGWTSETYAQAMRAPPGDEARTRLVGVLVQRLFSSMHKVAAAGDEIYVELDEGLSIISRHSKALGYDAVLLFLDELILWLASNIADLPFVNREANKLVKLVEFKNRREIPLVSFVARQRDLSELVGDRFPGADRLNFADILKHANERFNVIRLEDRNLPAIAEKRVLRTRSDECKSRIDGAFEALRLKNDVWQTLLTQDANREAFRQTYPFSPAFVQTLVASSSALQRERTALRIMLQMLVDRRDSLRLGELIPVGDLWDAVAGSEDAFSDVLLGKVRNARKLYQQKLRPIVEEEPDKLVANDRIIKTLLLADLFPDVPALKDLTPAKLAALNWGSIRSALPGREGQEVLARLRNWAARVGEIHLSDSGANPVVSLQVSGVDTEAILKKAEGVFDNVGNRCRKVRELLLEGINIVRDELFVRHSFPWRGTYRGCGLLLASVRELNDESLRCNEEEWKVVLNWPFDPDGPDHDRSDAVTRAERFRSTQKETRTVVWVPAFLTQKAQADLGKLVTLDNLLRGEQLDQYAQHLSAQDRATARGILDSQRNALTNSIRLALEAAYGFRDSPPPGMVEEVGADLQVCPEGLGRPGGLPPHERLFCLWSNVTLHPPVGATFKAALEHLGSQALEQQFPAHPAFEGVVKKGDLGKVLDVMQRAVQSGEPRVFIERKDVPVMHQVAEPLELGRMGDTHFVPADAWKRHFDKQLAACGQQTPTVRDLREWIDRPQPRGLPEEIENLLILVYALQANRSFFRHGLPYEASLDRLAGEVELRAQPLPSPEEWETARQRAAALFGIIMNGPLTWTNVGRLASEIQAKVEAGQASGSKLAEQIASAAPRLSVNAEQLQSAPRYRTATAVGQLLQSLSRREPTPSVRQLALARIETTAAAMARSLASAADVQAALKDMPWPLVDSLARITDERQHQAGQILQTLREALLADEHVSTLALALRDAREKAYRLLAQAPALPVPVFRPDPTTGPAVQVPPLVGTDDTGGVIAQGQQSGLDATGLAGLVADLTRRLEEDRRLRVEIRWALRREGEQP
jgi:hypothetical protein